MAVNGMAILECRKWQSSILGTGRVAVAYRASVRIALEAVTVSSTAQCAPIPFLLPVCLCTENMRDEMMIIVGVGGVAASPSPPQNPSLVKNLKVD